MEQVVDLVIVGAGMAGASVAYYLAGDLDVVLLEREGQPGYHSTGRSAALYSETYGNAVVRSLTRASRAFYRHPPEGFAANALLTPRGAMLVGGGGDEALLRQTLHDMQSQVPSVRWMDQHGVLAQVSVLQPDHVGCGIYEPDAMDMDVHAIHQGFLNGAKAAGARLVCDAEVLALKGHDGSWLVQTPQQLFRAKVVVNAAGAWCDKLAGMAQVLPIGLVPKRRTAFLIDAPTGVDCSHWPLVIDAHERFYFKPDTGSLLISPANEDPVAPQDVQPEEIDIALAVDRIESATSLRIRRVNHQWAGLRSFVADKTPVVGYAPDAPGFFWLAGQGGYGIQTAPAMGMLAAALIQKQGVPDALQAFGVQAQDLSPARLALAGTSL